MCIRDRSDFASRSSSSCLLQLGLEVCERQVSALRVLVDPPVVDQPDGDRVQEMQFLPALPARDYEPCVLEDSQVLHDAEARHLQLRLKLGQRAAVTLKEQVEQEATRRISERLEHTVLVCAHASTMGDHTVTCQVPVRA